jgi:DNA-directed RNA polymerase specialized sigma24 family protein
MTDRRRFTLITNTNVTLARSTFPPPPVSGIALTGVPTSPEAMLTHPLIVAAIRTTLKKRGVKLQDLEDRIADVQVRVLDRLQMGAEPNDVREMERLCRVVAKRMVANEREKEKGRSVYHVGLVGEPDDYAPLETARQRDPVDQRRLLDILHATLAAAAAPERAFAILDGVAAGETYAEIGTELGLTERAVRYHLEALREDFRLRVIAAGLRELAPRKRGKRSD